MKAGRTCSAKELAMMAQLVKVSLGGGGEHWWVQPREYEPARRN